MGLTHIFGNKPLPVVLDFFRLHQFWGYSLKDVQKATGVSHRTLQGTIKHLGKNGFIKYTRTEGKAKMYIFNSDSTVAIELHNFARRIDAEFLKSDGMHKEKKRLVTA